MSAASPDGPSPWKVLNGASAILGANLLVWALLILAVIEIAGAVR